jgi:hypothetical protein
MGEQMDGVDIVDDGGWGWAYRKCATLILRPEKYKP